MIEGPSEQDVYAEQEEWLVAQLTRSELQVYNLLVEWPEWQGVSDVANNLAMEVATASRALRLLFLTGLIDRKGRYNDRRYRTREKVRLPGPEIPY